MGSAGWASIIVMNRSFVGGPTGEMFKGEVWPVLRRDDNILMIFLPSRGRKRVGLSVEATERLLR